MMKKNPLMIIVGLCAVLLGMMPSRLRGQVSLDGRRNVVTSAVPFLQITPDARSGGLADAGVAISPDPNAVYWNLSKLAFTPNEFGFSYSYTPWLKVLVPDMNISYLAMYKRMKKLRGSMGFSLRYFTLGTITFRDQQGNNLGDFNSSEFSVDAGLAQKLSEHLSLGVALRFIYSNLTGNLQLSGGIQTHPGIAGAGDISLYYEHPDITLKGKEQKAKLTAGLVFSNIGSKITYTDEQDRDFIPATMRLGAAFTYPIDDYNEVVFTADVAKLMVPTPPVYQTDSLNQPVFGPDGSPIILYGKNPDVPVVQGILQSFTDAPGGFKEELREYTPSVGMEYWYARQFALRAGYFYEHETKGNRQYVTLGVGLRYNVMGFDFAYLIPTNNKTAALVSPLQNTLRFSLQFNFAKSRGKSSDEAPTPAKFFTD